MGERNHSRFVGILIAQLVAISKAMLRATRLELCCSDGATFYASEMSNEAASAFVTMTVIVPIKNALLLSLECTTITKRNASVGELETVYLLLKLDT